MVAYVSKYGEAGELAKTKHPRGRQTAQAEFRKRKAGKKRERTARRRNRR